MVAADGLREKLAWVLIRHGRVLMTRNQGRGLFTQIGTAFPSLTSSCSTRFTWPVSLHKARPL
jgi:hypothetical protein